MHRIATYLACAALFFGAGCATDPGQRPAGRNMQDFAKVTAGKTTANEVRALLGPPDRELTLRANRGHSWGYRHGGREGPRMFWVEISPDGIARDVSDAVDFDLDRRYRGL